MPVYYSTIASLLRLEELPESLGKLKGDINDIFNQVYYRNLQTSHSENGDAVFYDMELMTSRALTFDVPGVTGMEVMLNPTMAAIPFSLTYQLPVLKYLKDFDLETFEADSRTFYDLLVHLSGQQVRDLLKSCILVFIDALDPVQQFIDDCNNNLGYSLVKLASGDYDEVIDDLVEQIGQIPANVLDIVFSQYIATANNLIDNFKRMITLFKEALGDFTLEEIRQLFVPSFTATMGLSAIDILFPTSILQPRPLSGTVPGQSRLSITGDYKAIFDSANGLEFVAPLSPSFSFTRSELLNTGFIVDFTNAKIDLSRKKNLKEAIDDGRPDDFMGVFVEEATITFPATFATLTNVNQTSIPNVSITRKIIGEHLLIGTGGFSGKIGLEAGTAMIPLKLGLFELAIADVAMEFHMSKLISSSLSGVLLIPKFKKDGTSQACIVGIDVFIKDSNDYSISADLTANPVNINCFDIFSFSIRTLGLEVIDGKKAISVSGQMSFKDLSSFIPLLGDILPKNIDISKLIIWENGSIDFELGEIPLPSFNLNIGPIKVSVSGLSYSTAKIKGRQYGIISFNGMVQSGSGGFDGRVNGVRLYFTTDGSPFLAFFRIESLKVDIKIPGNATREEANVLIEGYLSVKNQGDSKNPENNPEYAGGVSFALRNLGIAGSASMRMTPSVPSFIVDVGIELSVPIPLAATGLGIYGVRGLVASNYHVSKTAAGIQETDSYWLYYKAPKPKEGITTDKFDGNNGFNLGGGVSLATMGDNGRSFSSKLFVMLGIPEIFLLQGQAAFLKQRCGLDPGSDPPFSAFLAVDPQSISAGIGAKYSVPADGSNAGFVLDLQAQVQMAYFFGNSSAWYVNFGKDFPETERIRAKLFGFIDSYAYLMISARGIKGGAGASLGFNKKFGPVKVGANAYINVGGQLSFRPVQIGGFVDMGGEIYARVYGFGFSFGLRAMLAAEAPRPYRLKGSFTLSIGLPWPFDDIDIDVSMEWQDSSNGKGSPDHSVIPLIKAENNAIPVSAVNMHTLEKFNVKLLENVHASAGGYTPTIADLDKYVIPLDSYIDIEFANTPLLALADSNINIKGNTEQPINFAVVPPQKGFSQQDRHTFELTKIKVKALKDDWSGWVDYDIWGNVADAMDLSTGSGNTPGKLPLTLAQLKALPTAYWQNVMPGSGKLNKLRILAQDMFSFMNQSAPGSLNLESFNFNGAKLFCHKTQITTHIINWENKPAPFSYEPNKPNAVDENTTIKSTGSSLDIVNYAGNSHFNHAVKSKTTNGIEINFNIPLRNVSVKFDLGLQPGDINAYDPAPPYDYEQRWVIARAIYFKREEDGVDENGYVKYKYTKLAEQVKYPQTLADKHADFTYTAAGNNTVARVIITCDSLISNSPTANGMISIGRQCLYSPTWNNSNPSNVFKGTIGNVSIYGTRPQWGNWNPPSARTVNIAKYTLNGNVANTAMAYNSKPYDDISNAIDDTNGLIVNGLTAYVRGAPTFKPLYNTGNYYTFNNDADAIEIPAKNYYYMGFAYVYNGYYYNGLPYTNPISPYTLGTNFAYSVAATFKTSDQSDEKRVIIDKRNYVYLMGYFGFTLYLLNRRLHIDLLYGDTYTWSYDNLILTDGVEKAVYFTFDPTDLKLTVWINSVKVCDGLLVTELTRYRVPRPVDMYLQEIRYFTQEDFEYNQTLPTQGSLQVEAENVRDGLGKSIQPIWRPDTVYAIEIEGRHRINGVNAGSADPQKHSIVFRTRGPLGFFHEFKNNYPLVSETPTRQVDFAKVKTEDEFKLALMKHYIDTSLSYPDPDGNIIYAKPLFRDRPKIKLYYLKPYVRSMFRAWAAIGSTNAERKYSLRPVIIDPDTQVEVPFLQNWTLTQAGAIGANVDLMNRFSLEGFQCQNIIGQINAYSYWLEYTLDQVLKPNRIYDINIVARFETTGNPNPYYDVKVHAFTFRSSRYLDFTKQVDSFDLGNGVKAKYQVNEPLPELANTDPLKVLKVLLGITTTGINPATALKVDELTRNYNTKYEAITDNLIRSLRTIPAPAGTDVYIVYDQLTSKAVGLLLRNPEAFFEPSIPDKYIYGDAATPAIVPAIQCTTAANVPVVVSYVCSKDAAGIFIYNAGLNLTSVLPGLKIKVNQYAYNPDQKTYTIISNRTIQL